MSSGTRGFGAACIRIAFKKKSSVAITLSIEVVPHRETSIPQNTALCFTTPLEGRLQLNVDGVKKGANTFEEVLFRNEHPGSHQTARGYCDLLPRALYLSLF